MPLFFRGGAEDSSEIRDPVTEKSKLPGKTKEKNMAALERGLGRGLDSLLRSSREAEAPSRDGHRLAINQLVPGSHQPRRVFDDAALAELSVSLRNQGVIQPLIVRPKEGSSPQTYEIVAGERRWRAAKLAGLTEVPVIITNYTDVEAMTAALVENLQREDLNPLEEAEALQSLREAHQLSQEDLAARLGRSRSSVANALRLLQLSEDIRQGLGAGKISAGHARALLAIADEKIRSDLYAAVLRQNLSVRETEAAADCWKRTGDLPEGMRETVADSDPPAPARRVPKPQSLRVLQKRLRQSVHHGASISGSEEKGRIALPYASREELEFLLHLLGLGEGDETPEATPAENERATAEGEEA